jgi:uncharacterized repeat protein (TIGR03803 family)
LLNARAETRPPTFLLLGIRVRPSLLVVSAEPHGEEAKSMQGKRQFRNSLLNIIPRATTAALAIAVVFVTLGLVQSSQSQTFKALHSFTGGAEGGWPYTTPAIDNDGNLYGANWIGGSQAGGCQDYDGCGTVYRLRHVGAGWVLDVPHQFTADEDGGCFGQAATVTQITVGPDGYLYGTTVCGGPGGFGTVFSLRPPAHTPPSVWSQWAEHLVYGFRFSSDGAYPKYQRLAFDPQGNIYGTTIMGGASGGSSVFEVSPSGTERVLYSFGGALWPSSVILDSSGNVYGTTSGGGGASEGTVFQLTPSGNGWTARYLHEFQGNGDGENPISGVISDSAGNLYGTTSPGSIGSIGGNYGTASPNADGQQSSTVFMLTPSSNGWTFTVLYTIPLPDDTLAGLAIDPAGNLYGTTGGGLYGCGSLFRLSPGSDGWTYTDLYDFNEYSDGCDPQYSTVVLDAAGNLYGALIDGGDNGYGVIYEITP